MEVNKLSGFVLMLVMVGMILGVGVLILDGYSRQVREPLTQSDTLVNISSAGGFSNTFCLTITEIKNATAAQTWDVNTYGVVYSNADLCYVDFGTLPTVQKYNFTYTVGADSDAQTVADNTVSAITPISSTWLPLIVTVAILAIIMTLVITSFAGKR